MAEKQQLTAQQRAQLFAMSTRENFQMLASQKASSGATTLNFDLPKARLLANIICHVKATVSIKHATATEISTDAFTPYKIIRRWSLDLNNGFSPFVVGGQELAMYNLIDMHPETVLGGTDTQGYTYFPKPVVNTTGKDNSFEFTVQMPVTTNHRDPIGLILLQNDQTNVKLVADIANGAEVFENQEGYTVEIKSVEISVCTQTFSVPANANAYPDLSVLKLVNSRSDSLPSIGQQIVKLSTGTIYKKIIFMLLDENGSAIADDDIGSNIELVFNQADVNYSINPRMLRVWNEHQLGKPLPKGMYAFLFDYQGLVNMGGSRDFIDTEKLTEFWLRFSTTKKGKILIVNENLARLQ